MIDPLTASASNSVPADSGILNGSPGPNDTGCFGQICAALTSVGSLASGFTFSLNAQITASSSSLKAAITRSKEKDPDIQTAVVSLSAMLATAALPLLDSVAIPAIGANSSVSVTGLNPKQSSELQSEASISAPQGDAIFHMPAAGLSSTAGLNYAETSVPARAADSSQEPIAETRSSNPSNSNIDSELSFNLIEITQSAIPESAIPTLVCETTPAAAEPADLPNSVVVETSPSTELHQPSTEELPFAAEPVHPKNSATSEYVARLRTRIQDSADVCENSPPLPPQTAVDCRPTQSDSSTPNDGAHGSVVSPTKSTHPSMLGTPLKPTVDPSAFPSVSEQAQSASAEDSRSLAQAAESGQIASSLPVVDPGPAEAADDYSSSRPEPGADCSPKRGTNDIAQSLAFGSQTQANPLNIVAAQSLSTARDKNQRSNEETRNPSHNDQTGNSGFSNVSQPPGLSPTSDVHTTGSGAVPVKANATNSPSPDKVTADPSSFHLSDPPHYAAANTGTAQLAHILNQATHSEMRIGLNTSAFGDVEVRTVVRASEVGVQIGSEKGDLRALLINDLPNISSHLQQQSLHLTEVTFQSSGFGSNGDSAHQHQHARPFVAPPRAEQRFDFESDPNEARARPAIIGSSGLSVLA